MVGFFFFSSRRRHTRYIGDWSSDVCSSDLTVGQQLKQEGYQGCWVRALGTNETADVYVGSPVGLASRIRQMMSQIGGQPVMWVNVKSLFATCPYSETNMLAWNRALIRAFSRYPNMRVYDWASAVK